MSPLPAVKHTVSSPDLGVGLFMSQVNAPLVDFLLSSLPFLEGLVAEVGAWPLAPPLQSVFSLAVVTKHALSGIAFDLYLHFSKCSFLTMLPLLLFMEECQQKPARQVPFWGFPVRGAGRWVLGREALTDNFLWT